MITPFKRLMLGGSAGALAAMSSVTGMAQAQPAIEPSEEVVVTGTSIRGVAPVGSNLISVTSEDITSQGGQTIGQILLNVPAITGMGLIGQGQTNNSYYQPTIHQLGGSSSNATLVIFDGHRAVPGGTNHSNEVDPNVIPTIMIERVEVLTDGSSSIYGSDAVSGVINFITRKKYEGVQLSLQEGFLQGATDFTGSVMMGATEGKSSIVFAYQHTRAGAIKATARPWTYPQHSADAIANGLSGPGTTNFLNFNCDPATIQMGGSGSTYYVNATSGATVTNAQNNAFCTSNAYTDLVPKEVRNNAMMRGSVELSPNLTVTMDLAYANLRDTQRAARGTLQATAFGAGAQANPFYTTPAGYAGTATKETIRWDSSALLGDGAFTSSGVDTTWADVEAEYRIGDNFVINFLASLGRTSSFSNSDGTINTSAAYLALNGSVNANGSTTTSPIPGANIISNAPLPLTAATALDVWNPASSNRTSQAVKDAILDNASRQTAVFGYSQYRISTNGTLLELPAGPLKIAVGAEMYRTGMVQFRANADGLGGATRTSNNNNLKFHQNVNSMFAEAIIPIVGPDHGIPLVQHFDLNVSGRYDDYDTVGTTTNPKIGFNWDVNDWLKLRGNLSTSFVAPVIDIPGENGRGYYVGNTFGGQTNSVSVPVAAYPAVTQFGIAGCTSASVTCSIASLQGVTRRSGDGNVKPQKGRGYSIGFDFSPDFLPGFTGQLTYWHTTLIGGVTAPNIENVVVTGSMQSLVTFYPGCASAAQIAALQGSIPLTSNLPACAQYLFYDVNSNYLNLRIDGIDGSMAYRFDAGEWGSFKIVETATVFTRFKEAYAVGGAGAYYDVLNTTGANGSFPSVQTQSRTDFGWAYENFAFDWYINYTSAYKNWNGQSLNPITFDANNNPAGGGDHVNANITHDFHISYSFQGLFGDDEITLSARNAFNSRPPFYNSARGWDTWVASPLGRIVTVGLRAKL